MLTCYNTKLSYRRETARQLPTWRGLGPPPTSPPPPLATPMRMVECETRNKRTSSMQFHQNDLEWLFHTSIFIFRGFDFQT